MLLVSTLDSTSPHVPPTLYRYIIYIYIYWECNGSWYPCQLSSTVVPGFDNAYCCIDCIAFCEDGIQASQSALVLVLGIKLPIHEALLYICSCWDLLGGAWYDN